jgi:hypothetical protein
MPVFPDPANRSGYMERYLEITDTNIEMDDKHEGIAVGK